LKLHGERRPSSMKSDVIRKRSRHAARRPSNSGNGSSSATPSASPGASRPTATSPTVNQDPSNSFSPASNEQHMPYYGPYDYSHASNSGMMGADEQGYPMRQPTRWASWMRNKAFHTLSLFLKSFHLRFHRNAVITLTLP
ncbi:hypothetical protein FRC08_000223, partial [Ceratobasidium sp. 394]